MPFTPREKFLYIAMSLNSNPFILNLPLAKRDKILSDMRDALAPQCTDKDYNDILMSSSKFSIECGFMLLQFVDAQDVAKLTEVVQKSISIEDIQKVAARVLDKIPNIEDLADTLRKK